MTTAAALAAAIVTGCAGGHGGELPASLDRAELLSRQGDQAGAAHVYEQLARQNSGAHRNDLVFLSAHAYLAAHLPEDASRVSSLLEQPLTADSLVQRDLLEVDTSLARGMYQQAWDRINAISLPRQPQLAAAYLRLKQRIALASGRLVEAVRAEDELEPWLPGLPEIRDSRGQLLAALREASERGVKIDPRATKDAVIKAWLELGPLAVLATRDPAGTTSQVQAWLARHPSHPAGEAVRSQLLQHQPPPPVAIVAEGRPSPSGAPAPAGAQAQAQPLPEPPPAAAAAAVPPAVVPGAAATAPVGPPPPLSPPVSGETVIALLLPVEGRAAAVGTTVRDGFLAAYYQTPAAQRPRVRVYDTSAGGIAEVIGRAVQEGATFIVGPLIRDEVTAVAELPGSHPPILALNFLAADHPIPADFYQYALSPENEARLAADRILQDGHRQGVALVPHGDWGSRVLAAFKQQIEAGGGSVVAAATMDTTDTDYSDAITQVLRISESHVRYKKLQTLLGTKLQFEPRRRSDIDFLFTPAQQPSVARMLRPQLRFHYAGSIPNYATSDAFEPDPRANQDLEGLMFPDMPFMLGGAETDAVRSAATAAWGRPRQPARLFAFGYDAYKLAIGLKAATGSVQIDGLTGRLTLDPEHRVHRDLNWVQLHNGEVRALPAGSPPAAQAIAP